MLKNAVFKIGYDWISIIIRKSCIYNVADDTTSIGCPTESTVESFSDIFFNFSFRRGLKRLGCFRLYFIFTIRFALAKVIESAMQRTDGNLYLHLNCEGCDKAAQLILINGHRNKTKRKKDGGKNKKVKKGLRDLKPLKVI
jgi:hypothetical protein